MRVAQRLSLLLVALAVLMQLHAATSYLILPLVAGAGLLQSFAQPALLDRRPDRLEWALLLWLLCWLLSAFSALHVQHAFALSVPTLVFALLFALLYRSSDDSLMNTVLATLLLLAVVQAGSILVAAMAPGTPQQWIEGVHSPWLLVPNDLTWMLCLWPLWIQRLSCRPMLWRLGLGLMLALQAAAMLVLQSRLAMLALLILLLAVLARWLSSRLRLTGSWWRWLLAALVLGAVAGVVALAFGKGGASMQARWQLWQAAWALWLQHPWLGIGPHGFGLEYRAAVDTAWVDPRHTPWPHQLPLELLANTGLISLLAFSRVVQQALIGLRSGQADRQALLQASALSFIVFSTVCLLEASTLRLWWWVVLACLLGSLRPDENRQ
jgi:hypothetical protein